MSYDYFDSRGWIDSGPSAIGQVELRKHLERHAADSPVILFYCEEGFTESPRKFAAALARLPIPSRPGTAERFRELLHAARRADGVLILWDGVG